MRATRRRPAVLVGFVVAWAGPAAPLLAQPEARLLLHLPFDSSTDAAVAAGAAHGDLRQAGGASPHKSDRPVFVPGIRGQALDIGRYDYEVRYDPTANIDPHGGTLIFWARRLGDAPAQPYTYRFC